MKRPMVHAFVAGMLILAGSAPALGASKETIQMLQQLDELQRQVKDLQKTVDTQTAVLKTLVEQANDNINSMKAAMAELQKTNQQNLATTANRLDGVTTQIQELSASLDETKARLGKLSDQMSQTQNMLQTLNTSAQPQGTTASNAGPAGNGGNGSRAVPDPNTLYQSGLSYYNGGQYDLAIQAFQEFLQNYPDSDYASNAQFYIGDCYYNQKNYEQAIEAYNTCIERYPKGNKLPAAQLKKGYALLALGQKQAGIKELRSLVQRFPDSDEANLARGRLKQLGATTASARRRSE